MFRKNYFSLVELKFVFMLIFFVGVIGEGLCLYRLVKCDFEPSYKAEIVYGVSFFTGVGAITGFINIEDVKR
jgi:hypothetical protein